MPNDIAYHEYEPDDADLNLPEEPIRQQNRRTARQMLRRKAPKKPSIVAQIKAARAQQVDPREAALDEIMNSAHIASPKEYLSQGMPQSQYGRNVFSDSGMYDKLRELARIRSGNPQAELYGINPSPKWSPQAQALFEQMVQKQLQAQDERAKLYEQAKHPFSP